ncbi:Protein of unknown function [Gryllus bimaculatus]|nr:Protein of unknown function [Gryllus bimaculatus]
MEPTHLIKHSSEELAMPAGHLVHTLASDTQALAGVTSSLILQLLDAFLRISSSGQDQPLPADADAFDDTSGKGKKRRLPGDTPDDATASRLPPGSFLALPAISRMRSTAF